MSSPSPTLDMCNCAIMVYVLYCVVGLFVNDGDFARVNLLWYECEMIEKVAVPPCYICAIAPLWCMAPTIFLVDMLMIMP